ncbi:hypothetical protein LCGC14_2938920 [marine sediment metagenome]|uniref:Uncharacterized protein n=1 Tax=marine sediment metagenome TaxID=412755 RepID=A0A0F9A9P7_9ZZZZ
MLSKCVNCGSEYDNHIKTLDGRHRTLSKRTVCYGCKPFKPYGNKQKPPEVLKENRRKYREKHAVKLAKAQSRYVEERRRKFRKLAADYKGGKCTKCGYNKCLDALEFHHRNPTEKEFNISSSYCLSWENIKRELDKCDLLCANCHREVEYVRKIGSSA